MKKTVAQRRDVLVQAWPNIAVDHGANFALSGQSSPTQLCDQEWMIKTNLEALFWPYINIEDLTKPKSLLIFLNSRARNLPWTFAMSESEFSPHGFFTCWHECLGTTAMMRFFPTLDPRAYMEIMEGSFRDGWIPDGHVHTDILEGLQILRTQVHIMAFLADCCYILLHDITGDDFIAASVQVEPPRSELLLQNALGHTCFSDILVVAPYIKRADIDFARLEGYVIAMCDEMKDHVFMLREDPSYFADTLEQAFEHQTEMVPNKTGRSHATVGTAKYLGTVLTSIVSMVYEWLIMWHEISANLGTLETRFRKEGMNRDWVQGVLDFEALLNQISHRLSGELRDAGMSSPTLRSQFLKLPSLSDEREDWKFQVLPPTFTVLSEQLI